MHEFRPGDRVKHALTGSTGVVWGMGKNQNRSALGHDIVLWKHDDAADVAQIAYAPPSALTKLLRTTEEIVQEAVEDMFGPTGRAFCLDSQLADCRVSPSNDDMRNALAAIIIAAIEEAAR